MTKSDSGRCFHNIFIAQHLPFGGRMLSISMLNPKKAFTWKISDPGFENFLPTRLNFPTRLTVCALQAFT